MKKGFIPWFICLIKRDMSNFTESKEGRQRLYEAIKGSLKNEESGRRSMDFTEAIALALAGDERGFRHLYRLTYRSKYYLALQYMKNEETAKDVLQDAYIRAFSNLDKIQNPQAFSSWLGTIVANTAKNALAKKNPMLFSDMAADDEDEDFEDRIEDDNVERQPELSYTKQETQALVRALIDSLSEEQRICILLFHIEGASISEIAQALNCSDNTVKSRLSYGRKNLKAKAEELQKRGHKLYSIAAVPLLLLLLRANQKIMAEDGTLTAAEQAMADRIFAQIPLAKTTGSHSAAGVQGAAEHGAGAAVKTGLLHTAAGKITAVVLGVCIVGAGVFYGVTQYMPKEEPKPPIAERTVPAAAEVSVPAVVEAESAEPEREKAEVTQVPEPEEKEVAEDEYASLIAGNLTKEELAFVLAYGPQEISDQGVSESEHQILLATLCCSSKSAGSPIADLGIDANYSQQYSLEDVNRMFYAFTEHQFTEDNDTDTQYGFDVDGDVIKFVPPTLSYEAAVAITSASYTETEMKVYFDYEKNAYEQGTTKDKKVATLQPIANGLYRIVEIAIAENQPPKDETPAETGEKPVLDGVKSIYGQVLQSVKNQEEGYTFSSAASGQYEYFLADMTDDDIPDLVVGAVFTEDVFEFHECRVFSCKKNQSGYQLTAISGSVIVQGLYIPEDGNGLYKQEFSRGTGQTDLYRITIASSALVAGTAPEKQFIMGDSTAEAFYQSTSSPQWLDIADIEGLKALQ